MPTSATQGYAVPEKVPVASGIVDAVASREGDRVVIEVEGEDQGGYGSAQMNLQMVAGQISSRPGRGGSGGGRGRRSGSQEQRDGPDRRVAVAER
jgi:hypothetical protein